MIWTFTPNPALDITWQAPDQTRGQVHRITEYSQRPGGKGLNVSRVLDQLGVPSHATGFLGGRNRQGDRLADEGNDFSGDARVG